MGAEGLEAARRDLRTFCLAILPFLDDAIPIAPRGAAPRMHSEYTPRAEWAMLLARLPLGPERRGAQMNAGMGGVVSRALHGRRGTESAGEATGGIGGRAPVHAQSKLSERSGRRAAELKIVR